MKKLSSLLCASFLLIVLFCFAQCKKNKAPLIKESTMQLYDKPLSTIQSYIQGKWLLRYQSGGICASCVSWRTDTVIYQFTKSNSIVITWDGKLFADASINWIRAKDTFSNLTFVMSFSGPGGVPYNYGIERLYNDTLIIYDAYFSDPASYHFTKY